MANKIIKENSGKKITGKEEAGDKKKSNKKSKDDKVIEDASYLPRKKKDYREKILQNLMKTFNYENVMQVPKLEKISLNMGIGRATQNPKLIEAGIKDLTIISGQKAVATKAKKSISNFKLRKGNLIGCKVTIRGNRMYEFLDKLISIAIPRIRDFRGFSDKSFDGRGNFSLGIKEQIIFPEINYDDVESIIGIDISIVTSAQTDKEAFELLKEFGFPFKK